MKNVILIFDLGKTNKKAFVFDEGYSICWSTSVGFEEIVDEDGDACEDLLELTRWVKKVYWEVKSNPEFNLKAINVSSYGASLVYLNAEGKILTPLYNYLKPYPSELLEQFYENNGGRATFAQQCASPILGSLNSGMQAYRLYHERPRVFQSATHILHLPNYIASLFSREMVSDVTSIGCHTNLWDFEKNDYHTWVDEIGLRPKLASIRAVNQGIIRHDGIVCGTGLHDSSAALIPYVKTISEPFVLLSTGTWNITLHPYNHDTLTVKELQNDCLCYLKFTGKPIKAARFLAGMFHETQARSIADAFGISLKELFSLDFKKEIKVEPLNLKDYTLKNPIEGYSRNWSEMSDYQVAYHQLMADIVTLQKFSMDFVLTDGSVKKLFIDGGFSQNKLFMGMLMEAYPNYEIQTVEIPQASAIGAALVLHEAWNSKPIPDYLIQLKKPSNF